jgi:hypothetical protein
MKGIMIWLYQLGKAYMLKQASSTGNQQFVTNMNNAFNAVEVAWADIEKLLNQGNNAPNAAAKKK